jgi:hypothetical protein
VTRGPGGRIGRGASRTQARSEVRVAPEPDQADRDTHARPAQRAPPGEARAGHPGLRRRAGGSFTIAGPAHAARGDVIRPGQRRRADSNRRMEVLQTSALPLGYGAVGTAPDGRGRQSGTPGSNRRPSRWQRDALPTELVPHSPTESTRPWIRSQPGSAWAYPIHHCRLAVLVGQPLGSARGQESSDRANLPGRSPTPGRAIAEPTRAGRKLHRNGVDRTDFGARAVRSARRFPICIRSGSQSRHHHHPRTPDPGYTTCKVLEPEIAPRHPPIPHFRPLAPSAPRPPFSRSAPTPTPTPTPTRRSQSLIPTSASSPIHPPPPRPPGHAARKLHRNRRRTQICRDGGRPSAHRGASSSLA